MHREIFLGVFCGGFANDDGGNPFMHGKYTCRGKKAADCSAAFSL